MMVLRVVNNLILIAIVLPNETIIYVDNNFKSLYRPTFTLEGVDMKVISFQMTPTMFVAM